MMNYLIRAGITPILSLAITFTVIQSIPQTATASTPTSTSASTAASAAAIRTGPEIAASREVIVKFKASDDNLTPSVPKTHSPSKSLAAQAQQIGIAKAAVLSTKSGKNLRLNRAMTTDTYVLALDAAMSDNEALTLVQQLNDNADALGLEYASLNGWLRIAAADAPHVTPNDPLYAQQWHYQAQTASNYGANLPGAWDITTGSPSLVVAVVDTGIRFDHADLAGRTVAGYDFVTNATPANDGSGRDADASDPGDWVTGAESLSGFFQGCPPENSSWHGTHVAGTIGAATNNSAGVAGINWQSKIQPVRVLGKCGGSFSDIIDGMRWAAGLSVAGVPDNPTPARVLNLSLGGSNAGCNPASNPDASACKCPAAFQDAVNQVVAAGAIIVVAAGNENMPARAAVPSNCVGVITVAATDKGGDKASYSNFDSSVEISAPGGETNVTANGILSTLNAGTQSPAGDSFEFYQGTSMATPHVVGIVSLMLSIKPSLFPGKVLQILQSTATAFPGGSSCNTSICGAGIINAAAAVAAANSFTPKQAYMPIGLNPFVAVTLKNGNFDAGRDGSWTQYSTDSFDLILSQSEASNLGTTVTPHSGTYFVWLGGLHNENGGIHQQITVSAATPNLIFYHRIGSGETTCGKDIAQIRINDTAIKTYNLCTSQNTSGWVKQSVNLAAFAGQTVKLEFNITTNASVFSSWYLDTVSLSATP